MKLKKILIIFITSIIASSYVLMSNNIINPFKKNLSIPQKTNYPNSPLKEKTQKSFSPNLFEKLISIHSYMKNPQPHDWLATHREEGQKFSQFIKQNPITPDENHKIIYIILLGDFSETQKKIIYLTAEFIEYYFSLKIKFEKHIPLSAIPSKAMRIHPVTKDKQILSTYILDEVLTPKRPEDAFCMIAFTASDLWPGEGWNFVFGQASIEDRVGVWSIYRNGNPDKSSDDFNLCLLRTLKTGTHEIGHMFSLHHCIYFQCNMNGSNHRMESDNRPLWLCPVCLKKLHWSVKFDIDKRYDNMIDFCIKNNLKIESDFLKKSQDIIQKNLL